MIAAIVFGPSALAAVDGTRGTWADLFPSREPAVKRT